MKKKFMLLLVLVVLVSFGQMLQMNVWQDDQALFFKLAHIQEAPGYFGAGPFGSGVYKYAATPFIPVYWLFGFNTVGYFGLMLLLYIIATLTIYKVFSLILGEKAGRVAGIFYAAGYITSDSFWRMANSATTSISIILASLCIAAYWLYFKKSRLIFYISAFLLFALALELGVARMHYFFVVMVAFELIFLGFRKPIFRSLFYSVLRLIPFLFVFYRTFIAGGDQRSGEVKTFVASLMHGQFYQLYGFFGSLANLIIPDWMTNLLVKLRLPILPTVLFSLIVICFYRLFLKRRHRLIWTAIFSLLSLAMLLISGNIFHNPLLNISSDQVFVAGLGMVSLIIVLAAATILKHYRREFLFLWVWLLANIAAYSAYYPTVAYETMNRYLAHSFVALVGILGIVFVSLNSKSLVGKIGKVFLVILVLGNLINNVMYQHRVVASRSYPTREFYDQLKLFLPTISKGDILYFDIAPQALEQYKDAISAAMMPDSTSFAWRYGIDRYDFVLASSFEEMLKSVSETRVNPKKVQAFWYSGRDLIDVSPQVQAYLNKQLTTQTVQVQSPALSIVKLAPSKSETTFSQPDINLPISQIVMSAVPVEIDFELTAKALDEAEIIFPLVASNFDKLDKATIASQTVQLLAIDYQNYLDNYYKGVLVSTTSDWQDRISAHLTDQDTLSVWQADRVLWVEKKASLTLTLPQTEEINRLVWINGYPGNTPTDYSIEVSSNGTNWQEVKRTRAVRRINDDQLVVETFNSTSARFVKFVVHDTIGDSPGVAEIWVVPSRFSELDLKSVDQYLANPFVKVERADNFQQILRSLKMTGAAKIFWQTDKYPKGQTSVEAKIKPIYDGFPRHYRFTIPAGGTRISGLRLSEFNIPGQVIVSKIIVSQPYTSGDR